MRNRIWKFARHVDLCCFFFHSVIWPWTNVVKSEKNKRVDTIAGLHHRGSFDGSTLYSARVGFVARSRSYGVWPTRATLCHIDFSGSHSVDPFTAKECSHAILHVSLSLCVSLVLHPALLASLQRSLSLPPSLPRSFPLVDVAESSKPFRGRCHPSLPSCWLSSLPQPRHQPIFRDPLAEAPRDMPRSFKVSQDDNRMCCCQSTLNARQRASARGIRTNTQRLKKYCGYGCIHVYE